MRSLKTLIAAAGVLALSIGIPAALMAPAAWAASTPVVYARGTGGWSHPNVRPSWILVGMGGAPGAHIRHWSSWDKGEPGPARHGQWHALGGQLHPELRAGQGKLPPPGRDALGCEDPQRRPVLLAYDLVHAWLPAVWLPHQHRGPALQRDPGYSAVLALISREGAPNILSESACRPGLAQAFA